MADNFLWSPSKHQTNLNNYIKYLKNKKLHIYDNYTSLHNWSIKNKEIFTRPLPLQIACGIALETAREEYLSSQEAEQKESISRCPRCAGRVIYEEGCVRCSVCSWSACK